jgi:pimeloyl-ACP methyl ester carboxylesterase
LALDHPEVVRRLVLVSTHPGGGPGTAGPSPDIQQLLVKAGIRTEGELLRLFFVPTEEGEVLGRASLARIAQREPRGPGVGPAAVAAHGQAVFAFVSGTGNPAYPNLGSLPHPTLIAGGAHDAILPVVNSRTLAELIPNSQLVIYPDDAHAFLFVRHENFSRHVNRFLSGPAAARTPTGASRRS